MERGWPSFHETPKKITDDPYGAATLIRRLVMEQGITYWRRYLMAFAPDGDRGRLDRRRHLCPRPGDQPGLCRQEHPRHRDVRRHHGGAAVHQGRGDLRPHGDPEQDLERHPRQQPAAVVRQADEREHRLLLAAALVGVPGAAHRRRQVDHRRAQHAGECDRPRLPDADQHARRDGVAGPADVVHRTGGGAAGDADAAQAGEADQGPRLQPVHRHRRHPGDDAGIAAGHPHREGVHAGRRHAAADRRAHRDASRTMPTRWRASPTAPTR